MTKTADIHAKKQKPPDAMIATPTELQIVFGDMIATTPMTDRNGARIMITLSVETERGFAHCGRVIEVAAQKIKSTKRPKKKVAKRGYLKH